MSVVSAHDKGRVSKDTVIEIGKNTDEGKEVPRMFTYGTKTYGTI